MEQLEIDFDPDCVNIEELGYIAEYTYTESQSANSFLERELTVSVFLHKKFIKRINKIEKFMWRDRKYVLVSTSGFPFSLDDQIVTLNFVGIHK